MQRDDLLVALVLLEPVQAQIIESAADRHGQRGAKAEMQEKAATGSRLYETPETRLPLHPTAPPMRADDPTNDLRSRFPAVPGASSRARFSDQRCDQAAIRKRG